MNRIHERSDNVVQQKADSSESIDCTKTTVPEHLKHCKNPGNGMKDQNQEGSKVIVIEEDDDVWIEEGVRMPKPICLPPLIPLSHKRRTASFQRSRNSGKATGEQNNKTEKTVSPIKRKSRNNIEDEDCGPTKASKTLNETKVSDSVDYSQIDIFDGIDTYSPHIMMVTSPNEVWIEEVTNSQNITNVESIIKSKESNPSVSPKPVIDVEQLTNRAIESPTGNEEVLPSTFQKPIAKAIEEMSLERGSVSTSLVLPPHLQSDSEERIIPGSSTSIKNPIICSCLSNTEQCSEGNNSKTCDIQIPNPAECECILHPKMKSTVLPSPCTSNTEDIMIVTSPNAEGIEQVTNSQNITNVESIIKSKESNPSVSQKPVIDVEQLTNRAIESPTGNEDVLPSTSQKPIAKAIEEMSPERGSVSTSLVLPPHLQSDSEERIIPGSSTSVMNSIICSCLSNTEQCSEGNNSKTCDIQIPNPAECKCILHPTVRSTVLPSPCSSNTEEVISVQQIIPIFIPGYSYPIDFNITSLKLKNFVSAKQKKIFCKLLPVIQKIGLRDYESCNSWYTFKVDSRLYTIKRSIYDIIPKGNLRYDHRTLSFVRYFDDKVMMQFIRDLVTNLVDDEVLSESYQPGISEVITLARHGKLSFSADDYILEAVDYLNELQTVDLVIPRDFFSFYKYVTEYQICNDYSPVSFHKFLTIYNANHLRDLLRSYISTIALGRNTSWLPEYNIVQT